MTALVCAYAAPHMVVAQVDTQARPFVYTPLELGSFPYIGPLVLSGRTDISLLVNGTYKLLLAVVSMYAVGSIVFYGITYMVSAGSSAVKTTEALDGVRAAVYGLLLLLGAWIILNTINPELVSPRLNFAVNQSQKTTQNKPTSNGQVANTQQSSWQTGPSCDAIGMGESDRSQCPSPRPSGGGLCCVPAQ